MKHLILLTHSRGSTLIHTINHSILHCFRRYCTF